MGRCTQNYRKQNTHDPGLDITSRDCHYNTADTTAKKVEPSMCSEELVKKMKRIYEYGGSVVASVCGGQVRKGQNGTKRSAFAVLSFLWFRTRNRTEAAEE
eukprot:RCo021937